MPDTLTPAQFKAARESLGVSAAFVADRIGIHEQNVWRYEAPTRTLPVPERAAEVIADLRTTFDRVADEIATTLQESGEPGLLDYPTDEDTFERAHPDMAGWGPRARRLVVVRACALIGA